MNMIKTTAEIDSDGWLTVRTHLPEKMAAGPVEAVIGFAACEPFSTERGHRLHPRAA